MADKEQSRQAEEELNDVSFIDMLQGGDTPHSPEEIDKAPALEGQDNPPEAETPADSDRKPEERKSEEFDQEDYKALEDRYARIEKRLHDTQARLHEVCSERSNLRKELEAIGKDSDDDWFTEEETAKKESIEKKLKESDDRLAQLDAQSATANQDAAYDSWEAAARPVRKAHPDFDDLVYKYLYDRISPDSKDYDAAVRSAWDRNGDKSPSGAYGFASSLKEKLEMLENPEAYKKRLREEIAKENGNWHGVSPTGGEGLDLVSGVTVGGSAPQQTDGGFVESLFK